MQLWVKGDRGHWLVRLFWKHRKHLPFVRVQFWDGYSTTMEWR